MPSIRSTTIIFATLTCVMWKTEAHNSKCAGGQWVDCWWETDGADSNEGESFVFAQSVGRSEHRAWSRSRGGDDGSGYFPFVISFWKEAVQDEDS